MSAHTPGPWKVNATPHSSNQDFVVLDNGANGHSRRVCAVYSDRAEADACLIAAAPDLLAALEYIARDGDALSNEEIIEVARAAIAIATE
jgi:hypothetical protein